eukprot:2794504-Rhodomonas_salina.2
MEDLPVHIHAGRLGSYTPLSRVLPGSSLVGILPRGGPHHAGTHPACRPLFLYIPSHALLHSTHSSNIQS